MSHGGLSSNEQSEGEMSRREKRQGGLKLGRRSFLRDGARAVAAASAGTVLIRAAEKSHTLAAQAAPAPFELDEYTITELQQQMSSGKLTARSITEKYLDRIEEIDRKGPRVNSVIEVNPDAMAIAEALDKEREQKGPRGPLHGVPILIKDNIDTADRMKTTAGSLALAEAAAPKDAFLADRLRQAGAVLLGKTNLSEWANFRSTHSSSGWSARGGQTRNPYALDRNPCGSSSGSGAAVAANLCAAAVGTETDGSIVCPSSANSIVGIKPTLGLVSRSGIIPIAHSQDTAGPMARTVRDAAILLGALTGVDAADAVTRGSRDKAHTDYTKFLDPNGLRGARVGVARKFFGFSDSVDKLMNDAIEHMKRLGAVIIDPADIATAGKFDDSEYEVLLYEFKADLNAYLARRGAGAQARTLKDLIEFNERNREREMPYFGQEIFIKAQEKGPLTSRAYRLALSKKHRLSRAEGIDATIRRHRLDAIIGPTGAALADRPDQRRPLHGRQLHARGCGRVPERDGPGGLRPRAPGRHLVFRGGLQRAHADKAGLRLRAGDEAAPPAAVPAHGGPGRVTKARGAAWRPRPRRWVSGLGIHSVADGATTWRRRRDYERGNSDSDRQPHGEAVRAADRERHHTGDGPAADQGRRRRLRADEL
jgi:amidase